MYIIFFIIFKRKNIFFLFKKLLYIKLISINNERMTLKEDGPCPGFNYSGFIPKDFVLEE